MAAALGYARAGFPVFPCRETADKSAGSKAPYLGKGGLHLASSDLEQIREWWGRWPAALVGFPTGEISGSVVVDVDPRDTGADLMLRALKRFCGGRLAERGLPAIAKTQSGGLHLYFAWTAGVKVGNRTNLFKALVKSGGDAALAHIDVRGQGGYVIAPPSRMSNGANYEWLVRPPRNGGAWALPAAPAKLLDMMAAKPRPAAPVARPTAKPFRAIGEARVARYVEQAVTNICADARAAAPGERNEEVFKAALKLGDFVRGGQMSRGEAEALLLANLPDGVSPGEHKIQQTIANGLNSGTGIFTSARLTS